MPQTFSTLDINTILLMWSLCHITLAVALIYSGRVHRDYPPASLWGYGAACIGFGLLALGLRKVIGEPVSPLLNNLGSFLGQTLMSLGTLHAVGKTLPLPFMFISNVIAYSLQAYFSVIEQNYAARCVVSQLFFITYDAIIAYHCFYSSKDHHRNTMYILGTLHVMHIISFTIQAFGAVKYELTSVLSPVSTQIQYFIIGSIGTLMASAMRILLTSQDLQERLRIMAHLDPLTGATNRRTLEDAVKTEWTRALRHGKPVACLMLDLDHFKQFNDQHGHLAGDMALVQVSQTARKLLRAEDTWCRYGGEEFVVLLPETGLEQAEHTATRLRAAMEEVPLNIQGRTLRITVSIGVAACMPRTSTWSSLVELADYMLYKAKGNGRNRVEVARNTDGITCNMALLTWDASHECGLPEIDLHHQQLCEAAKALLDAVITGDTHLVEPLLHGLVNMLDLHFVAEEHHMRAWHYPDAESHGNIHRALLARAAERIEAYRHGQEALGALFNFIAHDVVSHHMQVEDAKFTAFMRASKQPQPEEMA